VGVQVTLDVGTGVEVGVGEGMGEAVRLAVADAVGVPDILVAVAVGSDPVRPEHPANSTRTNPKASEVARSRALSIVRRIPIRSQSSRIRQPDPSSQSSIAQASRQ
jgi:hypothetical protein